MPHDHAQKIKIFDPPASPSPTFGVWTRQPDENHVKYMHTKFGLKIFGIDFVTEI